MSGTPNQVQDERNYRTWLQRQYDELGECPGCGFTERHAWECKLRGRITMKAENVEME